MSDHLKKIVGYGWSGLYCEGKNRLGWMLSHHVADKQWVTLDVDQMRALGTYTKGMSNVASSDMYRVKITVEVVKNKRGRPIVRRTKRDDGNDDDIGGSPR